MRGGYRRRPGLALTVTIDSERSQNIKNLWVNMRAAVGDDGDNDLIEHSVSLDRVL